MTPAITTSTNNGDSDEDSPPEMVRVVAPATLEEGFTFEASVNDKTFVVVVPEGGVKEGQEFSVPYPKDEIDIPDDDQVAALLQDEFGVPKGMWRTTLCSFCEVSTQSSFWMGWICTPVLMAQILTRLNLTWKAEEGPPEETSMTFNKVVLSLLFMYAVGLIPFVAYLGLLVAIVFFLYVGIRLRRAMRHRYEIPPGMLGKMAGENCDDGTCIVCCYCCSMIQMARHTHDDLEYPGACCTTNGLEYGAPEIV